MAVLTYADIEVGMEASFQVEITEALGEEFAKVSGNYNSLHIPGDPYALETEFKKPISYGMLAGALISRLLGMHLPGLHSICLSQNLTFKKPIFYGVTVTVKGVVLQKIDAYHAVKIDTTLIDESGAVVVAGEALVKLLK